VPSAVPRQKSDLAPRKFAQDKSIAWLAERGLHVHFAHRGESGHGIQATAPDYSNFCLLQSFLRLKLRKMSEKVQKPQYKRAALCVIAARINPHPAKKFTMPPVRAWLGRARASAWF